MANLEMLSGQILRDATGAPYLSAKAYYWSDSGATTPLSTYSNASLASANTNPVISDGTTGAFGAIYLQAKRYWRTVTTSAGVSLPQFNLGPIDANSTIVTSTAAPSPTYPLLYWYDTTTGKLKRRSSDDLSWLDLGGIDSLINAASVTEQLAGTATDKSSTPDSVAALWQRGTDIASASTISLPASGGYWFNITGTTTITAISSAAGGRSIRFKFAGALTLTHNATSLILPGGANITTAAGDVAEFTNEAAQDATGSNWKLTFWQPIAAAGTPIPNYAATQAEMETPSSLLKWVTPGRTQYHPGVAKCWGSFDFTTTALASHNILSVADTGTGRSTPTISTDFSSANWACVVSIEQGAQPDRIAQFTSKAAGTVELTSYDISGAALADSAQIDFVGFGDQA